MKLLLSWKAGRQRAGKESNYTVRPMVTSSEEKKTVRVTGSAVGNGVIKEGLTEKAICEQKAARS